MRAEHTVRIPVLAKRQLVDLVSRRQEVEVEFGTPISVGHVVRLFARTRLMASRGINVHSGRLLRS